MLENNKLTIQFNSIRFEFVSTRNPTIIIVSTIDRHVFPDFRYRVSSLSHYDDPVATKRIIVSRFDELSTQANFTSVREHPIVEEIGGVQTRRRYRGPSIGLE